MEPSQLKPEEEAVKSLAMLRGQNRHERRRLGKILGVKILGSAKPIVLKKTKQKGTL